MRPLLLLPLTLLLACAAEAPEAATRAGTDAPPVATPAPATPPAAPPTTAMPSETETPCGAEDYASGLFGADIATVTLPRDLDHRIVRPGLAVTDDLVPERLNIHVDEDGTVLRLSCG